jgi:hypothetical protein
MNDSGATSNLSRENSKVQSLTFALWFGPAFATEAWFVDVTVIVSGALSMKPSLTIRFWIPARVRTPRQGAHRHGRSQFSQSIGPPVDHESKKGLGATSQPLVFSGAPGTIRTCDPQIRSLMLYPAELRARKGGMWGRVGRQIGTPSLRVIPKRGWLKGCTCGNSEKSQPSNSS